MVSTVKSNTGEFFPQVFSSRVERYLIATRHEFSVSHTSRCYVWHVRGEAPETITILAFSPPSRLIPISTIFYALVHILELLAMVFWLEWHHAHMLFQIRLGAEKARAMRTLDECAHFSHFGTEQMTRYFQVSVLRSSLRISRGQVEQ